MEVLKYIRVELPGGPVFVEGNPFGPGYMNMHVSFKHYLVVCKRERMLSHTVSSTHPFGPRGPGGPNFD